METETEPTPPVAEETAATPDSPEETRIKQNLVKQRQTRAALEKAQGNVAFAAEILGIKRGTLYKRIHDNRELHKFHRTLQQANPEALTIHREPLGEEAGEDFALPTEEQVALALEKEDKLIKKGLANMGLTVSLQDMAIGIKTFCGHHYGTCLQFMGGGLTKQFLQTMQDIEEIRAALQTGSYKGIPITIEQEIVLREDRKELLKILAQFNDRVNSSALIQAKIWKMKSDKRGGGTPAPKGYLDLESSKP